MLAIQEYLDTRIGKIADTCYHVRTQNGSFMGQNASKVLREGK